MKIVAKLLLALCLSVGLCAGSAAKPNGDALSCNIQLMNALGMVGPKIQRPFPATPAEQKYCPKNRFTCCVKRHFQSTRAYFAKGQRKFEELFGLVEQILTLFRGGRYHTVLAELAESRRCHHVLELSGDRMSAEAFFAPEFVKDQIEEVQYLLGELPAFVRSELSFFGTLMCLTCDAADAQVFTLTEGQTSVTAHPDTCDAFADTAEFQIDLAMLMIRFVEPLAELLICHREISEDSRFIIANSFAKQLHVRKEEVKQCKRSRDKNIPQCQQFCARSLHVPKLTAPLTKSNLKAYFRVLALEFAGLDADQFYVDTMGRTLAGSSQESMQPFINPADVDFKRANAASPRWTFDPAARRILHNTMSPYFFTIQSLPRLLAGAVSLLALLLAN